MAKRPTFELMEEYLGAGYNFRHNTVLNKIEFVDKFTNETGYLSDYKINSILAELLRNNINVQKAMLVNYLFSDNSKQFDPIKSYFEGLGAWDNNQPDYIQALADTITVPKGDRATWNMYLKRWLIATVGCTISEKVTNHTVLVGDQVAGKTRWTERLLPSVLKEYYYSGVVVPGDKDGSINLAECMLINLDELGNLNRGDLASLKQLITQSSIRVRRPYGTLFEQLPRRASFMGSVNSPEFLRDDTGNNGTNENDFTFCDLHISIANLCNFLQVSPFDLTVHNLEFGVNIRPQINASEILREIICFKNVTPLKPIDNEKGFFIEFAMGEYYFKIYDKGETI